MTAKTDAEAAQAESRADFMKRLFAVAVSVGFASTITRMRWISNASMPSGDEWHQLALLATALIATISSWGGYFAAIRVRPLLSVWRFVIDIALVFIYMILLISSGHADLLLPILVLIFSLYVLWDALTIYEHPLYYYYNNTNAIPQNCMVFTTYRRGFLSTGRAGSIRRGHIITVLWTVYFCGLLAIRLFFTLDNIYVMCVMASIGLLVYRSNKAANYNTDGSEKQKTGRTVLVISLLVVVLLSTSVGLAWIFRAPASAIP